MAKLPNYDTLLKSYPNMAAEQVKTLVGGRVDADYITNACTIRVSRSLNYSDAKVPFIKDEDDKQQTLKGADGLWYIFRVRILTQYLTGKYGKPNVTVTAKKGEGAKTDTLIGIKGIIGMEVSGWTDATGHYTLWDGKACVDATDYFPGAVKVMLWKAT